MAGGRHSTLRVHELQRSQQHSAEDQQRVKVMIEAISKYCEIYRNFRVTNLPRAVECRLGRQRHLEVSVRAEMRRVKVEREEWILDTLQHNFPKVTFILSLLIWREMVEKLHLIRMRLYESCKRGRLRDYYSCRAAECAAPPSPPRGDW